MIQYPLFTALVSKAMFTFHRKIRPLKQWESLDNQLKDIQRMKEYENWEETYFRLKDLNVF